MNTLQIVDLGVLPDGKGGDTPRSANVKLNANTAILDACVALGYRILSDNETLKSSDAGARLGLNFQKTGGSVVFPLASSVRQNGVIHFFNIGFAVSVSFQGSDKSPINRINAGESITYVSDGTSYWHVVERGKLGFDEAVSGSLFVGNVLSVGGAVTLSGGVSGNVAATGNLSALGKVSGVNAANLALNGSGELSNAGWSSSNFSSTADANGGGPFFGNVVAMSGNSVGDQSINIVIGPGVLVSLSGEVYMGAATTGNARLYLTFYDSKGNQLSQPAPTPITAGASWTQQVLTATSPANTAYVRIGRIAYNSPSSPVNGVGFRRIKLGIGGAADLYSVEAAIAYLGGSPALSGVPTFGGKTPFHTGNFNPSSYAPLVGATFSGAVVNRNATANQQAAFQSSSDIGTVWGNWNNTATAAMQVDCPNDSLAYVGMRWTRWGSRHLAGISATAGGSEATSPTIVFSFGANSNSHTFYSGGNAQFAGSLTQLSDYRIKSNVAEIDGDVALAALLASRPVEFDRADTIAREAGFIAHELQGNFPRLVRGEKDAMKDELPDLSEGPPRPPRKVPDLQSVNYIGLVPYLAAALQAAVRRIERLEQAASAT